MDKVEFYQKYDLRARALMYLAITTAESDQDALKLRQTMKQSLSLYNHVTDNDVTDIIVDAEARGIVQIADDSLLTYLSGRNGLKLSATNNSQTWVSVLKDVLKGCDLTVEDLLRAPENKS